MLFAKKTNTCVSTDKHQDTGQTHILSLTETVSSLTLSIQALMPTRRNTNTGVKNGTSMHWDSSRFSDRMRNAGVSLILPLSRLTSRLSSHLGPGKHGSQNLSKPPCWYRALQAHVGQRYEHVQSWLPPECLLASEPVACLWCRLAPVSCNLFSLISSYRASREFQGGNRKSATLFSDRCGCKLLMQYCIALNPFQPG